MSHATEPTNRPAAPAACGGVSAHLIENRILNPALDGQVVNLDQFNPSPEVDSHLEHVLDALNSGDLERAKKHTLAAIALNHVEGQMLRIIAGTADDAAATMRNVRSSVTALSGRRVVAKLTGPLGALLNGPDAEAARVVVETVRVTPVSMLTSKQARHQLGKAKMAKLEEFLGGQQ